MANALHEKGVDGRYHCPDILENGQKCTAVYDKPTGLGVHRRHAHKVKGASMASVAWRKSHERKLQAQRKAERLAKSNEAVAQVPKDLKINVHKTLLTCPDPNCKETFKGQRWMSRHVNSRHPHLANSHNSTQLTTTKGNTNGHIPGSETEQLTPGLVAELIAVGYIKARLETIANENDLPVREFGKRVAGYLYAHSSR